MSASLATRCLRTKFLPLPTRGIIQSLPLSLPVNKTESGLRHLHLVSVSFFSSVLFPAIDRCIFLLLKAVNCGNPTSPVNGLYNLKDGKTIFGSNVAYLCNEQHYLFGSNSTRCQGNKKWSDHVPICKSKYSILYTSN